MLSSNKNLIQFAAYYLSRMTNIKSRQRIFFNKYRYSELLFDTLVALTFQCTFHTFNTQISCYETSNFSQQNNSIHKLPHSNFQHFIMKHSDVIAWES